MCQRAEVVLECSPKSVPVGRHFVSSALSSWGVVDPDPAWGVIDTLSVVTAELLGNAVQISSGPIALCLEAHRDRIHIGVQDDCPEPAVVRHPEQTELHGRGLALVAAFAEQWGQTPFVSGKKWVWADVAVQPGSVLAEACHL